MSGLMCSMRRSRAGIQLGARWQFWKKTHLPLSMELRIMASARGPCWGRSAQWLGPVGQAPHHPPCPTLTWPWPREMAESFLENFISSANLYRSAAGSVPGDSTKMRGVVELESLNTADRLAVYRAGTDSKATWG